MGKAVRK